MGKEVVTELVLGPASPDVRERLSEAADWGQYAAQLRAALESVFAAADSSAIEVRALVLNQPLPPRYAGLRNGTRLTASQAAELAVSMAGGRGPYCRVAVADELRLEAGWDGFLSIYLRPALAGRLHIVDSPDLSIEWRSAARESVAAKITAVADDGFWAAVRSTATSQLTLICERFAYGICGSRWYCVDPQNLAEVADTVWPRSLLSVAAGPSLRFDAALLTDAFTAFQEPIAPGELVHKSYLWGADSLTEVAAGGYTVMLSDAVLTKWRAVVPDEDGVNRGNWEDD